MCQVAALLLLHGLTPYCLTLYTVKICRVDKDILIFVTDDRDNTKISNEDFARSVDIAALISKYFDNAGLHNLKFINLIK